MEINKILKGYILANLIIQIAIIAFLVIYFFNTRYTIRTEMADNLLNTAFILVAVSLGCTIGTLIRVKRIVKTHFR